MYAGLSTARGLLNNWVMATEEDDDDYIEEVNAEEKDNQPDSIFTNMTRGESRGRGTPWAIKPAELTT